MHRAHAAFTARVSIRCALLLAAMVAMSAWLRAYPPQSSRSRDIQIDQRIRRDGEALVALADARARGEQVRADFTMDWSNDFFKARPGTFVPFTLTFPGGALAHGNALLYIRVEAGSSPRPTGRRTPTSYAYETIFPVRIDAGSGEPIHLRRGFAVSPGSYRVTVVLGESGETSGRRARRVSVLDRQLEVPNFWTGELATSSVILAERIEALAEPVPPAELDEDPYAVGSHRIHPAVTATFNRQAELIVVFLVYNPAVGPDKHFDVQVDYHLFRKDQKGGGPPAGGRGDTPGLRPGEHYVTRTNPQRFTPSLMGPRFDPTTGAPVLAGQAILLADFEAGEYRLNIVVTDMLSRRKLSRDVTFAVVGSQP
jgi:hypothetical protein